MDAEQCRMARASLKWTLDDLAKASGLGRATLARFELGQPVSDETIEKAKAALEVQRVRFIDKGRFKGGISRMRAG